MSEKRGPWYLLTGLVLGIALGLIYSWVVKPVQYTNTAPNTLRADYKDQYRALIAAAYMANNDLVRARARLELLQDPDLYQELASQAQRTLAGGGLQQDARALGLLAVAIGQIPPTLSGPISGQTTQEQIIALTGTAAPSTMPISATQTAALPALPTQVTVTLALAPSTTLGTSSAAASQPAPVTTAAATGSPVAPPATATGGSATVKPTGTFLPTRTATITPGAPFVLERQEPVCDPNIGQPLIQVEVYDAADQPVPGVEAVINWDGGENHFFTGMKPDISFGYADFNMTPGVVYTLRLAAGGQIIPDLTPAECERAGGDRYWGTWRLVFVQP